MQPESRQHRRWIISGVEPEGIRDALDLGCGRGLDVAELRHTLGPEVFLTGLDRHEDRLVEARRHTPDDRARFMTGDSGEAAAFPTRASISCGATTSSSSTDPARFLDEIHRVLRPGVPARRRPLGLGFPGLRRTDHVTTSAASCMRGATGSSSDVPPDAGWAPARREDRVRSTLHRRRLRTRRPLSCNHGPESFAHARWKELEHLVGEGLISPADWERFRREQDDLRRARRLHLRDHGLGLVRSAGLILDW
ncbi:MAG: class I SAM-dependent methyltransferase [Planctomycetota bacterium]